jgi:hypothetical protein
MPSAVRLRYRGKIKNRRFHRHDPNKKPPTKAAEFIAFPVTLLATRTIQRRPKSGRKELRHIPMSRPPTWRYLVHYLIAMEPAGSEAVKNSGETRGLSDVRFKSITTVSASQGHVAVLPIADIRADVDDVR